MGLNGASAGSDRFTTFTEWHTVVHAHEAQSAVLSMICHGVYERFPRLRCAYMEAGCGWLPSWLHRIDEQLELAGAAEFPELTRSAWDTFRANCWISTECEDRYVADVIRWMGDDHIVYETDFPHPDSKYPHATDTFLALLPDMITDGVEEEDPVGQRRRPLPVPGRRPCRPVRATGTVGRARYAGVATVAGRRLRRDRARLSAGARSTTRRPSSTTPRPSGGSSCSA